ncbi:hypothetical protein [Roseibium marinum]|uniref:Uncharacterized protein n=1 Tax=Roseibium marinum TaxID=281252 RepID=A0A2S3ULH8_9HYPH|nr:hypothetical protein [Roseibium marinum]POF28556.1 hypothetical protein CLV41_113119 [Roseibium marinum]
MSKPPIQRAWRILLISLVLTAAFAVLAWCVWTYANIGAGTFAAGTLLTDMRFFIGLLAVFVVLSILDRIVGFVMSRFGKKR